jgi:hypothetical protein
MVAFALGDGTVALAQPTRLGPELQLNVFTTGAQFEPAIGMDASGNFVVVWSSVGQDGDGYGVFGRRFTAAGAPIGVEFQVNTYTTSFQRSPDVARDTAGDFVVVWQSFAQDGHVFGIFGQRFASSGAKQGGEFRINDHTLGHQNNASVAMDGAGDFVVAWSAADQDGDDYAVFGRRFNASGAAQGSEFQVNSQTANRQRFPSVGMDTAGDFVVVWSDENSGDISGQRWSSAGTALGAEFQVNVYTDGNQSFPSVGMTAVGSFVAVWQSYAQDGSDLGVFTRRFDSSGGAQGPELLVNTHTAGAQFSPQVGVGSGGAFVVTWSDGALDGDASGVFGLAFSRFGGADSEDFQINAHTAGSQGTPDVAMTPAGGSVAVWSSPHDGGVAGIFAQRFSGPGSTVDVDGNGSAAPLTDGLLVLRYLFGFRGATLITGAVAGDCTRCTAPQIEAFLATLAP